jgi:hypothetical protein
VAAQAVPIVEGHCHWNVLESLPLLHFIAFLLGSPESIKWQQMGFRWFQWALRLVLQIQQIITI